MSSLYGSFRQKTFAEIYNNVNNFVNDYNNCGIPTTITNDSSLSINTLYYLLYANYGNSTIASSDLNRFKYKLFSLIWQYGPQANKEREIQEKLIKLTDSELLDAGTAIYNNASNPSSEPGTDTEELLSYINNQNVSKTKKGYLSAYADLELLLKKDITQEFLNRFKPLFLNILYPENPLLYESEEL